MFEPSSWAVGHEPEAKPCRWQHTWTVTTVVAIGCCRYRILPEGRALSAAQAYRPPVQVRQATRRNCQA